MCEETRAQHEQKVWDMDLTVSGRFDYWTMIAMPKREQEMKHASDDCQVDATSSDLGNTLRM